MKIITFYILCLCLCSRSATHIRFAESETNISIGRNHQIRLSYTGNAHAHRRVVQGQYLSYTFTFKKEFLKVLKNRIKSIALPLFSLKTYLIWFPRLKKLGCMPKIKEIKYFLASHNKKKTERKKERKKSCFWSWIAVSFGMSPINYSYIHSLLYLDSLPTLLYFVLFSFKPHFNCQMFQPLFPIVTYISWTRRKCWHFFLSILFWHLKTTNK